MRRLAIILLSLLARETLAEQSPFMLASAPYYPQTWLWEPASKPLPSSVGIVEKALGPQGRRLVWEREGRALFELDPGQWLRLYTDKKRDQGVTPPIWSSRGNGLFTSVDPQQGASSGEWIVVPEGNYSRYLLIENNAPEAARWWVSTMTPQSADNQYPYRNRVERDNDTDESHWLFQKPHGRHVKFNHLAAADEQLIELEGPGNWRMEVRVNFDPEQGWERFIDVPVQLDGKPWKNFRLHPRTDHSSTSDNGLCEALYSYPESMFISLPTGAHKIAFKAPQAMSVRVLEMGDRSFALPRNQARPLMRDVQALIGGDETPVARFPYDEPLFHTLLENNDSGFLLATLLGKREAQASPAQKTAQLIDQRYRIWRPLSPDDTAQDSISSAVMLDVVMAQKHRGDKRYVGSTSIAAARKKALLPLPPGQTMTLNAPEQAVESRVKLTFPLQSLPFDLQIEKRNGDILHWRWMPSLYHEHGFDVTTTPDLELLHHQRDPAILASASGSFAVSPEDFPLRLTHNATETIRLSPFYAGPVDTELNQTEWERALSMLGPDAMLALLLNTHTSDAERGELEKKIHLDWKPLRNWRSAAQQLWIRGLSEIEVDERPFDRQSLPALINKLHGKADYLLMKTLKAVVVKNDDPVLRLQALKWLGQYYTARDDKANLNAYYSWMFELSPTEQLQPLADWLVVSGMEEMATRLYRLAETSDHNALYQQARLSTGWKPGSPDPSALVETWTAIWQQNWRGALHASEQLSDDNPWRRFLAELPAPGNPTHWLGWAATAPASDVNGKNASVSIRLNATGAADKRSFYSAARDLHLNRSIARPDSPVSYSVVGPIELHLAMNLLHEHESSVLDDWFEIEVNGNKKWFPVIESRVNTAIRRIPDKTVGNVGIQQRLRVSLGPGRHTVSIHAQANEALVDASVHSGLLMSNLVRALQSTGLETVANTVSAIDVTENLQIAALPDCFGPAKEHGGAAGMPVATPLSGLTEQQFAGIPLGQSWDAPMAFSEGEEAEELLQFLLGTLRRWPETPDKERATLVAKANAMAQPFVARPEIEKILRKLNRGFSWQLEETIISSAGSRRIPSQSSTDNPVLAEREALIDSEKSARELRLTGNRTEGFFTRFTQATKVRIGVRQSQLPYHKKPPGQVVVSLNEEPIASIELPIAAQTISYLVPPGEQQLRFRLEQATTDHWIFVTAEASIDGRWQSLVEPGQRRFSVASTSQPLTLYIDNPRLLRIDEVGDGGISHRYTLQSRPGELVLAPPERQSHALLRVYGWLRQTQELSLEPYSFEPSYDLGTTAQEEPQEVTYEKIPSSESYQFLPDDRLGGASRSTDGIYLSLESRRDFDTDVGDEKEERFFEAQWRHQQALECDRCYWRSDIFARHHTQDNIELVGTDQNLYGAINQTSWQWQLGQSLYLQTKPDNEWSWLGQASLIQDHDINEKLKHQNEVQVFARHLSSDGSSFPIDNDIYSAYKNQHQYGLKLNSTVRGRPWLDSQWAVNAGLASNEDFNPFEPDYVQASIAWRQYYRPLAMSATYRHRYYLSDDDRVKGAHRPLLGLAVKSMHGAGGKGIVQWGARIDYDLDRGEYAMALTLSWDNPRGRALRDYYPGRSSFHALRERDMANRLHRHQVFYGTDNDE